MPSQTKNPTTGSDLTGIGTKTWTNPTRVVASDNSYATVVLSQTEISHYLYASSFPFLIPAGATITDIAVLIERKCSAANVVRDYRISLVKGGVVQTENKADGNVLYTTSDVVKTYHFTPAGFTAADFNNQNVGVALSCVCTGVGSNRTVSVDNIYITLTFSDTQIVTLTRLATARTFIPPQVKRVGDIYLPRLESIKAIKPLVLTNFIVIPPPLLSASWFGNIRVLRDEVITLPRLPSIRSLKKLRIPTTWVDESAVTPTTWEDD